MGEILFLVKNGQKGRHGCVKSEHVLYIFMSLALESIAFFRKKLAEHCHTRIFLIEITSHYQTWQEPDYDAYLCSTFCSMYQTINLTSEKTVQVLKEIFSFYKNNCLTWMQ